MLNKVIVLGNNGSYQLVNEIKKNLEYLGFNVIVISVNNTFEYNNIFQRIANYILKKLFKNNEIEKNLKIKPLLEQFNFDLKKTNKNIDYTLFIRSDDFPKSFIKEIKKKSKFMSAYQWDGLNLFPDAIKRINYFDRFFVFDPNDLEINNKILPITNFYFDYNIISTKENVEEKSVYFFGTYINYRMDIIAILTQKIKEFGFNPDINIVFSTRDNIDKYKGTYIKFLNQGISFEDNIKKAQKSTILVDFVNGKHKGLSFRIFEAIGYKKKLITTNSEIHKYDFYHPNNFFILNENNINEIGEFLLKPYVELDKKTWEKYSFTNWIRYVLDIQPYQKIDLPVE